MSNLTYRSLYVSAKQGLINVIRDNDLRDYDKACDYVYEVADFYVPHYYTDIFSVFAGGGISYEMDDAGFIEGVTDVTKILQTRIYEELSKDLFSDLEDLIEDYLNEIEEEEEDNN